MGVSEGGEFLEITAPWLYDVRNFGSPGMLFQALLDVTMRTTLVRFEHDRYDGAIHASVTSPVEDRIPKRKKFRRILEALPNAVDR